MVCVSGDNPPASPIYKRQSQMHLRCCVRLEAPLGKKEIDDSLIKVARRSYLDGMPPFRVVQTGLDDIKKRRECTHARSATPGSSARLPLRS